jgi:hypothetical protein
VDFISNAAKEKEVINNLYATGLIVDVSREHSGKKKRVIFLK